MRNIKLASKVHFGGLRYPYIRRPIRLMYVIVLTFRSVWELIWGCIYNRVTR